MNEIGLYSILIAMFLSAYSGFTAVAGTKSRGEDMVASAENCVSVRLDEHASEY
jgi:hypothetical protein